MLEIQELEADIAFQDFEELLFSYRGVTSPPGTRYEPLRPPP